MKSENMNEKRIRKWEDILIPGLERSRKKKKKDPFQLEIEKAMGLIEDDDTDKNDIREEIDGEHKNPSDVIVSKSRIEEPNEVMGDASEKRRFLVGDIEMTKKEKEEYRKKLKKLEEVMGEFVSWKESMK